MIGPAGISPVPDCACLPRAYVRRGLTFCSLEARQGGLCHGLESILIAEEHLRANDLATDFRHRLLEFAEGFRIRANPHNRAA